MTDGQQQAIAEQSTVTDTEPLGTQILGKAEGGLRERKKAKTRASIREHAMRLFREQGYGETTVEKIAEAAEVSPSTFFRYFPTKEDLVLTDDYDPLLAVAFRAQPPEMGVIEAMRAALREVFATMDADTLTKEAERHELLESVPELRAARYHEYRRSIDLIAGLIAERLARTPEEFEVRAFAGALVGVMVSVVSYADRRKVLNESIFGRIDDALAYLGAGLPLPPANR